MQESAAGAGLTHDGMPAACTAQEEGFHWAQNQRTTPSVQRLGAVNANA